jgi:hypothetical protein
VIEIPKQKKKINWDKISEKVKVGFESVASSGAKIVDLATKAGIAYVGFNALKHPAGALTGLVALNLANSPNLASGVAGVAALTGLGALSMVPPMDPLITDDPIDDIVLGTAECPFPLWGWNPILFPLAKLMQAICIQNTRAQQTATGTPIGNGTGGGGGYTILPE